MRRCASKVVSAMISAVVIGSFSPVVAQEADEIEKLNGWMEVWGFVVADWELVEKRYSFDGELIQTNRGTARFTRAMEGQRFEELQTLEREDGTRSDALQVFVYDPRSDEVEIARTDSGHYGFWLIIGKETVSGLEMTAKHPNPGSKVTRRITYTRIDDGHFKRTLEFSEDKGESYFVRSEWIYSRK